MWLHWAKVPGAGGDIRLKVVAHVGLLAPLQLTHVRCVLLAGIIEFAALAQHLEVHRQRRCLHVHQLVVGDGGLEKMGYSRAGPRPRPRPASTSPSHSPAPGPNSSVSVVLRPKPHPLYNTHLLLSSAQTLYPLSTLDKGPPKALCLLPQSTKPHPSNSKELTPSSCTLPKAHLCSFKLCSLHSLPCLGLQSQDTLPWPPYPCWDPAASYSL